MLAMSIDVRIIPRAFPFSSPARRQRNAKPLFSPFSFLRFQNGKALESFPRTGKRVVFNPLGKKRTMSLTRAVILAALPRTAWEGQENTWEAITDLLGCLRAGAAP